MTAKIVSIIILNWNGLDFTRQCIQSLKKNTIQPYEVIVVDNGSKKKEVEELKKMKASGKIDKLILNEKNRGFSGGNNQGIEAAGGDYYILLNNDTTVSKNWLSKLVKAADKDPKIGIVGPDIRLDYEPDTVFGGGYIDDAGIARFSYRNVEGDEEQVGGAALFFKKSLKEKIGGLDEGFNPIYFEETDFCARAKKAGFRVVFSPDSKIVHFEGGAMKKQPGKRQVVTMNKNRLRYMLIHFPKRRLTKSLFYEIARFLKSIVSLKVHWLLEAYLNTLKTLPNIVGKRKKYAKKDFKA